MSAVPANLAGSVLQSHLTQGHVSHVRDADSAQKATAERKQAAAVNEKDTTVETADNDTRIYSDSEGTGGQGRAFSEPDQAPESPPTPADGSPDDPTGRHIDLQA